MLGLFNFNDIFKYVHRNAYSNTNLNAMKTTVPCDAGIGADKPMFTRKQIEPLFLILISAAKFLDTGSTLVS